MKDAPDCRPFGDRGAHRGQSDDVRDFDDCLGERPPTESRREQQAIPVWQ
jgi:hypothetical protein